ncbi:YgiQ family radical SAM protein [Geobacter argillaceus]|uniref:Putative radical SAM protein YgiQ n=1 Tax=Geobacter argillaceus TaxID=345631 RepID=A0A562WRQ3_9BACT|nr:YgiQ family radical SAM protein [Geobacter argillaceus]TWJ32894.1 putative radical SAM protein YgiQ [Geobacter argillaceus]
MSFIPITPEEVHQRGWAELDVIFVTGDAYIDHPAFGVPLLARWLEAHGFRVGIIAQPDWRSKDAFTLLGRPRLFFAVSAGAMDSLVAHYTPAKKLRHDDAYTPGNRHGARPNRATIVYTSCCKAAYRDVPVVVGGIEASLRRLAHYDYWEDKVRRSILFDSKADLLVYGMGERPLLELAERLRNGEPFAAIRDLPGTAVIARNFPPAGTAVPSFEEVASDTLKYAEAFRLSALEQQPGSSKPLVQRHGERWLVCNPPASPLATRELDRVYALPFTRLPHPAYHEPIPAWEQIKASITTHRGCSGGCAFCAITHHQGKTIQSRSEASVLEEIGRLAAAPWFRGSISDIGGPTANMYAMRCTGPDAGGNCRRQSCLFPAICPHLEVPDGEGARLLAKARQIKGVRHTAVASGIRYDLLSRQPAYFRELLTHQVGGLLKVAPEHLVERVTRVMRKPGGKAFQTFLELFRQESARIGKRQAVVPYFISGHPGCTVADMVDLALMLKQLNIRVEQVQDFTPTPGTVATCIYHTGIDPFTGEAVYVARSDKEKRRQKALLLWHLPAERQQVLEALRGCGRESDAARLLDGWQAQPVRSAQRRAGTGRANANNRRKKS